MARGRRGTGQPRAHVTGGGDGYRSPTKPALAPADVARLAAASFGPGTGVVECAELSGGGFAAVWRALLTDGRAVVLKVAPLPAVPLLRYERGLAAAEAAYCRLIGAAAPGLPVPALLHHGADPAVCDSEWLFTTLLPGTALTELAQADPGLADAPVRWQLGAAAARQHRITGPAFGYSGDRPRDASWAAAFTAMVEDLLADADTWGVRLPVPAGRIRDLVARHAAALAAVRRPALVHFDLWDGNVLAAPAGAAGALGLTGLVDGERSLFADPLMDFTAAALFRRIEDEPDHPFLRGYAEESGHPPALDVAALRRLALYRLHLYLLMIVEMPSRGMLGAAHRDRSDFLRGLLADEAAALAA
ncbi:MAG TPA: phosphotransferase [Pilimelia sp.]|nr:phosphotransferase [Pilimelia sp.]